MVKPRDRRNILAQSKEPAFSTGRLDVPAFVAARQSEIRRLEAAMAASSAVTKRRAFQQVPRVLRRRTASHNARRVPKRLRERAQREIVEGNALPTSVNKQNAKRPPKRIEEAVEGLGGAGYVNTESTNSWAHMKLNGARYAKRQQDKVWLPTHIWHRKRAHLDRLWGHMIPIRPSQKAFRATHRIFRHLSGGAMCWDTSYYSTIRLTGPKETMVGIIDGIFPGATKKLYTEAGRSWQGLLSNREGPALLLWLNREAVAIHVHPLLFESLWLRLLEASQRSDKMNVYDCRFEVGSIDVAGNQALPALHAVLHAVQNAGSHYANEIWQTVAGMGGDALVLPSRGTLSLLVHDPRLIYPPRLQRPKHESTAIAGVVERWPRVAQSHALFDPVLREAAVRAKVPQAQIDARRRAGNRLVIPTESDPCIPVSLFALEDSRIRILLPRAWVLPVWLSLTRLPHMAFGGVEQLRQLSFERGDAHFPQDYLWSDIGREYAQKLSNDLLSAHERRPPNKRPSFAVSSPFSADLSALPHGEGVELLPVKVTLKQGVPETYARIYSKSQLVGYITTGNFNLADAQGTGLGVVTLSPDDINTAADIQVQNVRSQRLLDADITPVHIFSL